MSPDEIVQVTMSRALASDLHKLSRDLLHSQQVSCGAVREQQVTKFLEDASHFDQALSQALGTGVSEAHADARDDQH
jgi:hypothetical protein